MQLLAQNYYKIYTPNYESAVLVLLTTNLSWHILQNNIDWSSTIKYISYGEKPLALSTDPLSSAIKNFKIKLLSEELPTYLLLHWRNAKKYPNYLCPRCLSAPEDITYLLICIRNHLWLTTLITQVLYETSQKLEIPCQHIDIFVRMFVITHITKHLPLGIITKDTLAPFDKIVIDTNMLH